MGAEHLTRTYGAGIIGNCLGEGGQLVRSFRLHPRVKIIAGYEPSQPRGEELAHAIGQPLVESADVILENPAVDIVTVACEPRDKAEFVRMAAEAHKHVLLIPPMCDSLQAARSMVAAVAANNVKLVEDQPLIRFNAPFARLLADAGGEPLGKVLSYYHNFGLNFAREFNIALKWPELLMPAEKMGGGELTQLGSQALDFAIALLGRPLRVQARWHHDWPAYQRAGVENAGQVILDYSGFFGALTVGRQQLEGGFNHSQCMHVVAESKTLFIDGTNGLIFRNNVHITWEQYMRGFEVETALDQLVRCIDEDATPASSVEVAADGMEVLMAVYRSILDDRPVDLPLGDGANPLQK